jgi:hypothetical protein
MNFFEPSDMLVVPEANGTVEEDDDAMFEVNRILIICLKRSRGN